MIPNVRSVPFVRPALVAALLLGLLAGWPSHGAKSTNQPPQLPAGMEFWQKGFTFYDAPESYAAPQTVESLKRLRATGANYVAPVVTWYVDGKYGSTVQRGQLTPSDDQLSTFIANAHALGLRVLLTLHVDSTDGTWRGFLAPPDVQGWFASYTQMVIHYAEMAAAQQVEGLVVGQELVSLSGPAYTADWIGIICQVRSLYHGQVTYSANWGGGPAQLRDDPLREFMHIQFWDYLDFLGVSAYFELSQSYAPTVGQLVAAWNQWSHTRIAPFQAQYDMPLVFTEVGYRSVVGAAVHPWDPGMQGSVSMQAQSDLYRAFFTYWSAVPWVAGVYIWNWEAGDNAGGPTDGGYTPENKPAEQVISSWFSTEAWWARAPAPERVRPVRASAANRCLGPLYVRAVGGVR